MTAAELTATQSRPDVADLSRERKREKPTGEKKEKGRKVRAPAWSRTRKCQLKVTSAFRLRKRKKLEYAGGTPYVTP